MDQTAGSLSHGTRLTAGSSAVDFAHRSAAAKRVALGAPRRSAAAPRGYAAATSGVYHEELVKKVNELLEQLMGEGALAAKQNGGATRLRKALQ